MAETILSVEKTSGGFKLRYASGGSRIINVGSTAELIHYTEDTVTYKENGKSKVYNLKTGGVRILG